MANPFLQDYLDELEAEEQRKLSWGAQTPSAIPLVPIRPPQEEKNLLWDTTRKTF